MFSSGFYITAELRIQDKNNIMQAREALNRLSQITLQSESGCTIFQLHQCLKDPTRLLLWERYDSEHDYHAHFEQPYTQEYLAQNLTEVLQYFTTTVVL